MSKRFFAITILALAALSASRGSAQEPAAQAPATPSSTAQSAIPPEAAKLVNPVKPSAESLARGKKDYGLDCAMCHGANGNGKGDLATDMKLNLKDYRDPASLKEVTDGEIFYIIKNGKGEMTGEGDRRKASELWDMVNYVRSLSRTPHKSAGVR
jgi:mono/diheme cytochrome c family protein